MRAPDNPVGALDAKHMFQVYGQGDTFTPSATQEAYAAGTGMAMAQGLGRDGGPPTFEEMDADGSGEITAEDFAMLRENRFAEFDTDGDGSVSEEEFVAAAANRASERAARMFARLDADGDGMLSRDALEARGGRGFGRGERFF